MSVAATRLETKRDRTFWPTEANLSDLVTETRAEIGTLVDSLAAGHLTPSDFAEEMGVTLERAHEQAGILGRLRAGDLSPVNEDDRIFAQRVMRGEVDFLSGFEKDIEAGRYTDATGLLDREALLRRAESYTGRVEGTANETFGLASPADALFHWRLGGAEAHCTQCPDRAAGGPYTVAQLEVMGYPRTNATDCLYHCRCRIVRSDGVPGFGAEG